MNLEDCYPRKVLNGFIAAGIHPDCVYASIDNEEGPCKDCRAAMKLVIHKFYADKEEPTKAFQQDIRNDQLGEVDD